MRSVPSKRKTAILLITVGFLLASLSFSIHLIHAAESSCVQCHTNEKQLQTLYKPQKVVTEQGEG
jgi:hypothetical protein